MSRWLLCLNFYMKVKWYLKVGCVSQESMILCFIYRFSYMQVLFYDKRNSIFSAGSDFYVTRTGTETKNPTQHLTTQSYICCTVVTRHSLKGTVTSVSLVRIDPCLTLITRLTCDISAQSRSPGMETVRVVWHFAAISSA